MSGALPKGVSPEVIRRNFMALQKATTESAADLTALDARLTTAEGDILTLDGRLDTAEADIVALDGRVTALESSGSGGISIARRWMLV